MFNNNTLLVLLLISNVSRRNRRIMLYKLLLVTPSATGYFSKNFHETDDKYLLRLKCALVFFLHTTVIKIDQFFRSSLGTRCNSPNPKEIYYLLNNLIIFKLVNRYTYT